ncbi:MAG TPA: SCO family protein [Candidatus Limnocylindrales bacterium]|nr:SCO family protein [Candidatus Limnocylindrales bacterium]
MIGRIATGVFTRHAIAAVLVAGASLVSAARASAEELRAGEFSPPRPAPDFALKGSDGSELTLRRFRGKVVIVEFGFTSCPAICPTTLATLARAHKDLGESAADVQVVYITVDAERDTVERLHDYLAKFDPTFVGGTGSEDQLTSLRKSYGVEAARVKDGGGYVHSSSVYLVDPDGNLRALMPYGQTPDDYVHDAKILLGR